MTMPKNKSNEFELKHETEYENLLTFKYLMQKYLNIVEELTKYEEEYKKGELF